MSDPHVPTPLRRRGRRLAGVAACLATACAAALALVPAALAAKPVEVFHATIDGTLRQNRSVTAVNGIWANAPTSYAYRWVRCNAQGQSCFAVSGQTAQTYFLSADDVGNRVQVVVTATNTDGSTESNSPLSDIVSADVIPAATKAPAITGTAEVGSLLTATTGTWSGGPVVTLQWRRCNAAGAACADIAGATGTAYGVVTADLGSTLVAVATGRNDVGTVSSASAATAVVAGLNAAKPATATALPSGETSVPAASVLLPQRLVIAAVTPAPAAIASASAAVSVKVRVLDTRGYAVSGAVVTLVPLPTAWASAGGVQKTGADGWAAFSVTPKAALPLRKGTVLTLFVRAAKEGDAAHGGVDAARIVGIKVKPA